MAKTAVLISDVGNDLADVSASLSGALPDACTGEMLAVWFCILPNIKYLCEGARAHGIPIIYVSDALPEKSPEHDLWPKHFMKGTKGCEPWTGIGKVDVIVGKENYVIFFGKAGEQVLDALRERDIDTVVACGTTHSEMMNIAGVLIPTPGLRDPKRPELGYTVIYPRDCVTGMMTYTEVDNVLRDIKRHCGKRSIITSSYELVASGFNITRDTQSYTIAERTPKI